MAIVAGTASSTEVVPDWTVVRGAARVVGACSGSCSLIRQQSRSIDPAVAGACFLQQLIPAI